MKKLGYHIFMRRLLGILFISFPMVSFGYEQYFPDFAATTYLVGDFNDWQIPEKDDYHGAIKMNMYHPSEGGIGGGYSELIGIKLHQLGKFMAYVPQSKVFYGFKPEFGVQTYTEDGELYTHFSYAFYDTLEEVIPFEFSKSIMGEESIRIWHPPFVVYVKNAELVPELIAMAEMDEVAVTENGSELVRYSTSGVPVDNSYKGLVLIRYADGTTRKVVVR